MLNSLGKFYVIGFIKEVLEYFEIIFKRLWCKCFQEKKVSFIVGERMKNFGIF